MSVGDCRLEWGDGSAERNVAALWDSIDDIIESNIGNVIPEMSSGIDVDVTKDETTRSEPPAPTEPESQHEKDEDRSDDSVDAGDNDSKKPQETNDSDDESIAAVDPTREPDIVEPASSVEAADLEPQVSNGTGEGEELSKDEHPGDHETSDQATPDG